LNHGGRARPWVCMRAVAQCRPDPW